VGSQAVVVTPPTEAIIASISVPVTIGDNVKIDHGEGFEIVVSAAWTITAEFRIFRDGVLIHTRTLNRSGTPPATQRFVVADTYVDTAPATTTSTYELRAIITAATAVTSAAATNVDLNLMVF
jgi:hypothetical protein